MEKSTHLWYANTGVDKPMDKIHFDIDDDIINPCWDNVFKAVFVRDTPESRQALEYLMSAILKRNLTVLTTIANEPPVDSVNERQREARTGQ